ncbi:MAG: anti-sigma factor antagonist [Candidatus Sulfotelmatobacter sp.]
MRLSLDTREVGRVTVVRCNGRIVAGEENESLRQHVSWLLRDRRCLVLHLGDVEFIDSSGLGTLVRSLTSTRQVRGDLKLCSVPKHVNRVLELSHLTKLFDAHESEEGAVAAFYVPGARVEVPAATGRSILCLDRNADVLAFERELLRRAGYDVHTSSHVGDALLLMRVTRFDLLLAASEITASAPQAFRTACAKLPIVELGSEFSTSDAGEAASRLLETIAAHFDRQSAQG